MRFKYKCLECKRSVETIKEGVVEIICPVCMVAMTKTEENEEKETFISKNLV